MIWFNSTRLTVRLEVVDLGKVRLYIKASRVIITESSDKLRYANEGRLCEKQK